MDTAVDEQTSLAVRRSFAVPVSAVYAAWTDPERMKHWMGRSDDVAPPEITVDLRVGGRYRIVMRAAGGDVHRVAGEYREIVPNRRLVYTWAWESTPDRVSLVTVELAAAGDGTELVLTHQRFADPAARDRHHEGWNGCLGRLSRLLAR